METLKATGLRTLAVDQSTLVATKLRIPPARTHLVPRVGLHEALNRARPAVLTLVSAPAGFGKSALLAEWCRAQAHPVAWISLDAGDNDPVRFWSYWLSALEVQVPGIAEASLAMLRSPKRLPVQVVLTPLVNALAEHGDAITLVLDDYHAVESAIIHEALAWLIEQLPPTFHVIIATRSDPPLPLARWRARRQLFELRAPELRFTRGEMSAFFNDAMGLELSDEVMAQLEARTEGWITGLQLAALTLRENDDPLAVLDGLSGSQRHIMDYLLSEVLARQPDTIARFLLDTAILKELCGSLCDAVTEQQDSQTILERLEAANLFLFPLDTERRWYRYHQLFAEALAARLHQLEPKRADALHLRACRWLTQHGLIGDAVRHALAGGNLDHAAQLIEAAAPALAGRGELTTLERWLLALPEEVAIARPRLCAMHAWVQLSHGHFDGLMRWLKRGDEARSNPDDPIVHGELAVLQAGAAAYRADISGVASHAEQALKLLPENHALRNIAAFALAGQHVLSGQVMKAARAFEEVARTSRQAGDIFATVYSLYHEAEALTAQGRLHEAATVYGETKQAATLPGGRVLPLAGFGDIGLGELRREWNDLDTAETLLRRGMVAVRPVGELAAIDGFIALARVQQAKGLGEAALNSLDTALQLVRHRGAFEPQHVIDCHRARFWLMQGHLDLVKRWMVKAETAISALPVPVAEPIALNLARAALALQKPAVALRRLGPLREPALKAGRIVNLLQILALQALAHEAQGRNRLALTSLSSALAFAEPGGFVRLFVDEGAALVPLLIKLRSARELEPGRYVGWSPDYLDKLLSAYASETPTIGGPTAAFEPLSAREQEVLRHIALGASNKQIAKALDIAPSTVKWYVQAIFGKLQVTSRTQAVARARESGLL